MATTWAANEAGAPVLVSSTFAERKAARLAVSNSKCVFEVRHDGDVIATFRDKQEAVAFTKSSSVQTEKFGWQTRPSAAAIAFGSASIEPACTIVAVPV